MKKYKNVIFSCIFVFFAVLVIIYSLSDETYEKENIVKEDVKLEKKENKEEKKDKVIVDIKGQVVNPGVYELTNQNNVNDVIAMAGGLTEYSDTSNINLSKKLSDEMVIIVYSKDEIYQMKESTKIVCPKVNNACICNEDEKGKLDDDKGEFDEETIQDDGLININEAGIEELTTLEGIGESKAKAIIEYREKNGKFESTEDIKKVSGIGEKAFEKIKDSITV